MAAPGRAAYLVGIQSDDAELTLPVTGFRRGKKDGRRVHGRHQPAPNIPRYAELWRSGQLDLSGMISHTLPLEDVNRGFAMMMSGESARTVIKF